MRAPHNEAKRDDDISALVKGEQLRMILAHTAVGTVAATAFALYLAYHLAGGALGSVLDRRWIVAWVALKLVTAAIRIWSARRVKTLRTPVISLRRTTALLAIDGVVWGAGAAGMVLTGMTSELATFVAASLCAVASVATFGLQVRFAATCAYVVPMIAPMSLAYLVAGGEAGKLIGVGTLIFLVLLLATSRRWENRMEEVFRLRIVTERVSQERAEALELAAKHATAKDRFLAVVSHELRTPLHGILGLTRLTQAEVPASDVTIQYRLGLLAEAGHHLQRMVNDLLDISAMEQGRLKLQLVPFSFDTEISLLRETYLARAHETGLRFELELSGDIRTPVIGDSVRVGQVLHNLLGNAFKFTPLGGTVRLSVHRSAGSDYVLCDVEDTGPGIPKEELETIFEVFEQGAPSDSGRSRPEGAGLGLAIARQLARAMGGDVFCESEVGKGSSFSFTAKLPIAPGSDAETAPSAARRSTQVMGAGRTVAIVDDDSTSCLVAATALRGIGCHVDEYPDGHAVLKAVLTTHDRPDVVLMDWDMPHVNGGEATRLVRSFEQRHALPRLPIVGLSASALPSVEAASKAAGMDAFLAKPCSPQAIVQVVEALLVPMFGGRRPARLRYQTAEKVSNRRATDDGRPTAAPAGQGPGSDNDSARPSPSRSSS
jgi:signal transduction histidine kinase/FixJ family two-component response regulator